MTFEEAVRKSIKAYFKGVTPDTMSKARGDKKLKYTKKYFDKVSEDFDIDTIEMDKFSDKIVKKERA